MKSKVALPCLAAQSVHEPLRTDFFLRDGLDNFINRLILQSKEMSVDTSNSRIYGCKPPQPAMEFISHRINCHIALYSFI